MHPSTSLSSRTATPVPSSSSLPSSLTQSLRTSSSAAAAASPAVRYSQNHHPSIPGNNRNTPFPHSKNSIPDSSLTFRALPLPSGLRINTVSYPSFPGRAQQGRLRRRALPVDRKGHGALSRVQLKRCVGSLFLDELGRPPLLKLPCLSALPWDDPNAPGSPCGRAHTHQALAHEGGSKDTERGITKGETMNENHEGRIRPDSTGKNSGVAGNNDIYEESAAMSLNPQYEDPPSPSTPLTPIPTKSSLDLSIAALCMISRSPSTDADQERQSTYTSSIPAHDNTSVAHESTALPSTPRSRPKPSPIATRLPSRASSLSLMETAEGQDRGQNQEVSGCSAPLQLGEGNSLGTAESVEVGGRDSGIALESWDVSHSCPDLMLDGPRRREQIMTENERPPSFDQLFLPQGDSFDPFTKDQERGCSTQRPERRQRCRSMIYPGSARSTEHEDPFSTVDVRPSIPADTVVGNKGSSETLPTKNKTRAKRVASMSLGSALSGLKHQHLVSDDLPPLPPKAFVSTSSGPRSSFFVSPSFPDVSPSLNYGHAEHGSSSSQSSFSSCASATISLSRDASPPVSSASTLSRGIPFSNMLDLATAKAENITGLYFAKQMNRKSIPLHSLKDPAVACSGADGIANVASPIYFPQEHSDTIHNATKIRIELDAPSLLSQHVPPFEDNEPLAMKLLFDEQGFPPATAIRSRTLTSPDPLTTSLPSKLHLNTTGGADFAVQSVQPPTSSQASVSTPTRGQHRRSQSASHFFHLSSLKHHSPAQFNLALCYEHGQGGVDKDLEKAIHFYQQAADQGHTKASYNIGCICYNQGQVSKAMAWFESAGKCSIRGLRVEAGHPASTQASTSCGAQQSITFPLPRQTTLPHDLEDMLIGDAATFSGPFAAYLPAILCMALLCRQGVQTQDGEVVLAKDQEQSIELLQNLLGRASSRSRPNKDKDHQRLRHSPSIEAAWDRVSVKKSEEGGASQRHGKSASQDESKLNGQSSSLFSASCPSLSLGMLAVNSAPGKPSRERFKRSATVQDEADEEVPLDCGTSRSREHGAVDCRPCGSFTELHGSDDHEAWSLTLAQQLLKAWGSVSTAVSTSTEASAVLDSRSRRILRHHLLYITNPTLGKNLYNLGVLYDLYLGDAVVAIKCYRSAYQNSFDQAPENRQADAALLHGPGLVTRINSAWNLGVLHVRRQEWKNAREWFLRAQQGILLHERHHGPCEGHVALPIQCKMAQEDRLPHSTLQKNDGGSATSGSRRKSLVNVVPHNKVPQPSDSPGRKHAQEHGLMMHLGAISSSEPVKSTCMSRSGACKKETRAGMVEPAKSRKCDKGPADLSEDGIRTDCGKIAWVLRWVESQMAC